MSQSSSDRWKRLFATSSSTAVQLMEIMLSSEHLSSTQPVSMLNSQESNVFIMLSSNIGSVNKKNSRLIPVRNQTGVSYAPENRQLTVDKWFSSLSLLSQPIPTFRVFRREPHLRCKQVPDHRLSHKANYQHLRKDTTRIISLSHHHFSHQLAKRNISC